VEEYFESAPWDDDWSPRYSIAPTQPIPVIRQNPREPVRELSLARWGLIPSWAKDASAAARMINARSETAAAKPAFRDALKSRRCLIPADLAPGGVRGGSRVSQVQAAFCTSPAIIYWNHDDRALTHRWRTSHILGEIDSVLNQGRDE